MLSYLTRYAPLMANRLRKDRSINHTKGVYRTVENRAGIFHGWAVLAVAFIPIVLGYAIRNTFSVFYPAIVEEFSWSRGNTALMFSITIIVYGLVAPVAGSLVDRFGPRLVLPVGACITGGGLALCSLATTQWHFYLLYGVVVAAGLSMIGWTPLISIISRCFFKERGLVFGILGAGFGASLVSAPVAQFLISNFGWQTAYVIIGLFSIAVIVPICTLFMRGIPQDEVLLPNGMRQRSSELQDLGEPQRKTGPEAKWTDTWTLLRALKTYHFWLFFLISFCSLGVAEQIVVAHQVFFFKDVGYEPMVAATIYSVFGGSYVVGTLCGSLSDRLGREKVFIPSCLLSAAAVSLLFLIKDTSEPWMPFLFSVSFGLGLGAVGPVFSAAVADLFHGKHFGSIQGTITLGFASGGAISTWLAGFLHDKTDNYFASFLMVFGSLVASAVFMWLVAPRKVSPIPS